MTVHLPACRAGRGGAGGTLWGTRSTRGTGTPGWARTGTPPDGPAERGPPRGMTPPDGPAEGGILLGGVPSWETTPPEALQMRGDRVAPGVIAEHPEPHRGGITPILPPPWGDHLPPVPSATRAPLFPTPRPLADIWRHLWLSAGVKGSSGQR